MVGEIIGWNLVSTFLFLILAYSYLVSSLFFNQFKRQLQSVVVDGLDVMVAAKASSQKSFARLEARDAAAKAAVKREEDRVAELKRIRGERWLPSIAKEKQLERQGQYNNV